MNKCLLILFVLLALTGIASATKIAYIVKTPIPLNPDEIALRDSLTTKGYSVTILDDDAMINPSLYDLFIVGEDVSSITNFDNKNYKTLFLSYPAAKAAGLSKYSGTTSNDKITISDNTHKITKTFGLGDKTVYTSQNVINYVTGCTALNSKSLAYKSEAYNSVLLILKEDSLLLDSSMNCANRNVPLNERNVFFGIPMASNWQASAKTLFLNSIDWLIEGEDVDGDGFYYENDCNDTNADIHPGVNDIPYNGIDENCDGFDKADVDKDGFCKQGYAITNKALQCPKETGNTGTDCNDNDISINPGSSDVYNNCKNDAPVIGPIGKIIKYETEIVKIEVNAIDSEGDNLTYSINDPRFSKNGNIFSWQTDYEDAGDYTFTVRVSDGSLEGKIDVIIEIKETNQAPICNSIPALEWKEDEKSILNLKNYCSDPDGDELEFYINDTSEADFITIDSFENGTVNFSSKKDWNGEDWIIFKARDGKDYGLTNKITLKVSPVNDAPSLIKNIGNIIWDEDKNLINYINLNEYFKDVDSSLSYSVQGNNNINITIANGLASFYPKKDWNGTENVVFKASDGEFSANSNAISLTVNDANEPPEFGEINCNNSIAEDTKETCELKASDFEDDSFSFSIGNENHLDCNINGNNVEYISSKDYNGPASCIIRASDSYGYNEFLLQVNILPVNDAPVIKDYSPKGNPRILSNVNKEFNVVAFDADSSVDISWILDGIKTSSGASYTFNKSKGSYNLVALVTDNEFNVNQSWNIFVGDTSEFTCSEVNGYLCSDNQVCSPQEEIINVKDTNSCCAVQCSPKFSETDRCEKLSDKISVQIDSPDENDDFQIGESVDVSVKVENNDKEDIDADIEAYLYDLDKDKEIENDDDSVDISDSDSETVEFTFDVPEDAEENKYAVFVRAKDGELCNEDYVEINIERETDNIIIDKIDFNQEAVCGDSLDIETTLKNEGSKNQDVLLKVENSQLNILEKTTEFEIEKFDEKDTVKKELTIKIPDNAPEGTYNLKFSAEYNGEKTEQNAELILGKCNNAGTQEQSNPVIPDVQEEDTSTAYQSTGTSNKAIIILSIVITAIMLIVFIYLIYLAVK